MRRCALALRGGVGAALQLSTICIAAQVLYLELDAPYGRSADHAGRAEWRADHRVAGGQQWRRMGRAGAGDWLPCGQAACCFVLAKSTENPEKRMLAIQREQRAQLELQRFERIAALERRIFEHAFAAFDQVEQQLGGPVQVQALPAAGQTGEAAQDAKSKRTAAKAITAEFQTLDPAKTTESAGSSNGHRSFRSHR